MQFDFKVLAPAVNGLDRLLTDVGNKRDKVFCLCYGVLDYQLNPFDILRILRHAGLAAINNDERLCPVYVRPELFKSRALFEDKQRLPLEHVLRVHKVLTTAFPNYRIKKRLADQPEPIMAHLKEAFIRLVLGGYLPAIFREKRFGHLGMVLLMLECSQSEAALVQLLKSPSSLDLGDKEEHAKHEIGRALTRPANDLASDPPPDPPTARDLVLSQIDLLRLLESSDLPDKESTIAAANNRLLELTQPSLEELDRRFDSRFEFDKTVASNAIMHAEQLLSAHENLTDPDPAK